MFLSESGRDAGTRCPHPLALLDITCAPEGGGHLIHPPGLGLPGRQIAGKDIGDELCGAAPHDGPIFRDALADEHRFQHLLIDGQEVRILEPQVAQLFALEMAGCRELLGLDTPFDFVFLEHLLQELEGFLGIGRYMLQNEPAAL